MTDLAAAARFELQARERHWPKRVAEGAMTQAEADADIAAWRAIAELLDSREVQTDLAFADLVAAAQRAVDSRSEKAIAKPCEEAEQRLGNAVAIRRTLIDAAHAAGSFAWRHAA